MNIPTEIKLTGLKSRKMRNLIMLVISLFLSVTVSSGIKSADDPASDNSLSVFCSPDLEGLVSRWAGEFRKQNQGQDVKVVILSDDPEGKFNSGKNLGFISSQYSRFYEERMWNTIVGRDVTVLVFNAENPLAEEVSTSGIPLSKLADALGTTGNRNWGLLLKSGGNYPFNIYIVDDQSINAGISELPDAGNIFPGCIRVENAGELVTSMQNDKYSIGICKMSDVMDPVSNGMAGINLLPVDRNENGSLDYMERIYDNPVNLSRGVWMGKYPSTLFNNIYSVSSSQPVNKAEKAFLIWCLTEGQTYLNQFGFSELLRGERDSRIEMLTYGDRTIVASETGIRASTVLLLMLGLLSISFIISLVIKYIGEKRTVTAEKSTISTRIFDENNLDIMPGLYYDKSHTWAFMEKDGMVRIGLDDFIQHVAGHVTRVKMKNTVEYVIKWKPFLSIIQYGMQFNI